MTDTNKDIAASIANALIAAIPIIGSSANSLIGDYQTGRKLKRLEELYLGLKNIFDNKPDLVNSDYLKKDDFLDIFEETAKKIVNERSEIKREAFRNILIHSIEKNNVNYNKTEEYLDLLERLREPHLFILKILSDPVTFDKNSGTLVGTGGGFSTSYSQIFNKLLPSWQEEDIMSALEALESYRLITNLFSSYESIMTDQGINHLEGRISEKGKSFMSYCLNKHDE